MKRFLIYFGLCLASFLSSCGSKLRIFVVDDTTDTLPHVYTDFSKSSSNTLAFDKKMVYVRPEGFKPYQDTFFKGYPELKKVFSSLANSLISNDENVIISISVYSIYTSEFEDRVRGIFPTDEPSLVDRQHIPQLKGALEYLGKETAGNWKKHVTYYPETEAKEHFKADSVIRFHIPLREKDFYKKHFKYVDALYIQKKGHGYAQIYVFYTDKAKTDFHKYWQTIEGILTYKE